MTITPNRINIKPNTVLLILTYNEQVTTVYIIYII